MENIRLISGRSNIELANNVASYLGLSLTPVEIKDFNNGEIYVQILDNVRGKDIYVIQTGVKDDQHSLNDYIMELEIIADSCRLSSAKSVTAIIPNFPYARADKKDMPRTSITGSLIARKLKNVGIDRIVSMDLHSGQIQGFIDIPFDNLYAMKLIIPFINQNVFLSNEDKQNYVLVSPDAGGIKRILSYAKHLEMPHIIMHKQRDYTKISVVQNTMVIGDKTVLKGKTAILIDDIIDTMGTMLATSHELMEAGAKDIIIIATHGIFSGQAIERINNAEHIKAVIVTNSISQSANMEKCSKIKTIDTADLFAKVICRIVTGDSISELFII